MTDTILYLTTLGCPDWGDHDTTFAHRGPAVPIDQKAPWPDVNRCPVCGTPYPDDLGAAVVEQHEAVTYPPELREFEPILDEAISIDAGRGSRHEMTRQEWLKNILAGARKAPGNIAKEDDDARD